MILLKWMSHDAAQRGRGSLTRRRETASPPSTTLVDRDVRFLPRLLRLHHGQCHCQIGTQFSKDDRLLAIDLFQSVSLIFPHRAS